MRISVPGVAVLLSAVLLVGGCGDGGQASTDINATATEFQFEPNDWTVPEGEEFTVAFANGGSVDHEWAVLKLGEDIESESEFAEEKVLFEVEAIGAGTDTTQSFTIDEAGTYQVICAIEGHFNAGMEGSLHVE